MDADSLYLGIEAPALNLADSATIVMADSATIDGTVAGSVHPPTAPSRSMFQTNSVAMRFIQPTSWALARSGTVSALTGVAW
jgi:hypothetical protein